MTDQEAANFAENLWLYRVRRGWKREFLAKGVLAYERYRRIEYGLVAATTEEMDMLAKKLQTDRETMVQPPDYSILLRSYRIRKIVELSCVLRKKHQHNMIIRLLRDLTE